MNKTFRYYYKAVEKAQRNVSRLFQGWEDGSAGKEILCKAKDLRKSQAW